MSDKSVKCVVMRDYWDENAERVSKGTEVYVSTEDAMDGIETGALQRVKTAKAKK